MGRWLFASLMWLLGAEAAPECPDERLRVFVPRFGHILLSAAIAGIVTSTCVETVFKPEPTHRSVITPPPITSSPSTPPTSAPPTTRPPTDPPQPTYTTIRDGESATTTCARTTESGQLELQAPHAPQVFVTGDSLDLFVVNGKRASPSPTPLATVAPGGEGGPMVGHWYVHSPMPGVAPQDGVVRWWLADVAGAGGRAGGYGGVLFVAGCTAVYNAPSSLGGAYQGTTAVDVALEGTPCELYVSDICRHTFIVYDPKSAPAPACPTAGVSILVTSYPSTTPLLIVVTLPGGGGVQRQGAVAKVQGGRGLYHVSLYANGVLVRDADISAGDCQISVVRW